tara:strand:- start:323 stop:433 length:111 start_codon:yes stop_codon:yes gene_type:complete
MSNVVEITMMNTAATNFGEVAENFDLSMLILSIHDT